ncbi:hypothetical protein GZH53_15875 [Flavihumibacter sp. R14]|nr:hypothetical protein [Flavihumibacter soli]
MNYRYSKLALTDSLWSLIPIFPLWTIFFGVFIAEGLRTKIDCEKAYWVTEWGLFGIAIGLIVIFVFRLLKWEKTWKERQNKRYYRLFNLAIYTLINNSLLILIVSPNIACYGQSDSILAVIISGPISSVVVLIVGLSIDLLRKSSANRNLLPA